eukprot:TRINITY_DN63526_c0_g1_i1.p1 TRINITY_DN63526_c0_g1~~TRINITY_DN63526_c0_g1_i1.p1  ORF type:complete len:201 (+),score=36.53 TRINITY_DN63526_c0_g1_i1:99-701(+)
MAGREESVSPHIFAMKLNALLVLVLIDCACNGFADNFWQPSQLPIGVVFLMLPIALHLVMLIIFFTLLWHTFLLRYGLLLEVWHETRAVIAFSLLRLGVMLAARIPRLIASLCRAQAFRGPTCNARPGWGPEDSPEDYWADPLHSAAFFGHNILTVVYDAWLLRRSYGLANVRFYKPQLWQKHRQRREAAKALSDSSMFA